jgi:TonB family protein
MKTNTTPGILLVLAVGVILAFAIATIPTSSAKAGEVYATGLSGGKTRPVDIENKLVPPPKERPIKEAPIALRKQADSDSARVVEDADKYQLYIDPMYPRKARLALKEGVVEVQITFDKAGKMKDARIVHCSTPNWGFEQAVLAASLEARLNGRVDREVTVKASLKFQLD